MSGSSRPAPTRTSSTSPPATSPGCARAWPRSAASTTRSTTAPSCAPPSPPAPRPRRPRAVPTSWARSCARRTPSTAAPDRVPSPRPPRPPAPPGCATSSSPTAAPGRCPWAGRTSTPSPRRWASASPRSCGRAGGTACRWCARPSSSPRCATPTPAGSTGSRSPTRSSPPTGAASCPSSRRWPTPSSTSSRSTSSSTPSSPPRRPRPRRATRSTSRSPRASPTRCASASSTSTCGSTSRPSRCVTPAARTSRSPRWPSRSAARCSGRCRGAVERALRRREQAVELADRALGRLPARPRTREWISTVYKARRDLDTLRKFTSLYQPYTQIEVVFDDARTRALHESLPPERRTEHGFDVTEIDWQHYLQKVHIPGVPGLMRQERPRSTPRRQTELPRRSDVVAVFDLQRTVIAATLVEQYLWVELATRPPAGWPRALANLVALGPRYLQAEMRDRGDFIRTFMRRYAGTDEAELRAAIAERVQESLRRDVLTEAVAQIRAHRRAGHRTVLVTGEIDVFVEPIAPLFDVVVAGKMEKDEDGRWTGHLLTSPLVGESRATWLTRYAREEGLDLSASYAYGDSYADRPWLQVVGKPNVVNPDAQLYRYARAQRWPVHSWTTPVEGRFAPVLRSLREAVAR